MFVTHGTPATLILVVAVVVIVFMTQFFSWRERESRHRVMQTLAEKGQPIPPELLTSGRHCGGRYTNPIQAGVFMMCIGVALAVFFWAINGGGNMFNGEHIPNWLPFIGIFPFMVGLARVIGGIFERRPSK